MALYPLLESCESDDLSCVKHAAGRLLSMHEELFAEELSFLEPDIAGRLESLTDR